jgi:hypothetical protein
MSEKMLQPLQSKPSLWQCKMRSNRNLAEAQQESGLEIRAIGYTIQPGKTLVSIREGLTGCHVAAEYGEK